MLKSARVILVLAICVTTASAAEVDNLLPKETELVLNLNIKQLIDADIVKKNYLPNFQKGFESKEAQKFLGEIGLDPLRDIERITVALWGKTESMDALMIIRGTFDTKKMREAAERFSKEKPEEINLVREGEVDLVELKQNKEKPSYLLLAEGRPIVGGTDKKIVAAAAALDLAGKPALGRDLSRLVQQQDAKASIFACGFTEGKIKEAPDLAALKNFGIDGEKIKAGIMKMKTVGLTLNFGKELSVNVKMGMSTNDEADDFSAEFGKLSDAAKAFLPILTGTQPKLSGLLEDVSKTLTSSSKDKTVILSLKLSAAAIDQASQEAEPQEKKTDKEKVDK